jgi:predicted histidine transporter YuiF (NhaC family)
VSVVIVAVLSSEHPTVATAESQELVLVVILTFCAVAPRERDNNTINANVKLIAFISFLLVCEQFYDEKPGQGKAGAIA